MDDDVSYYTELTVSHVEDKTEWKRRTKVKERKFKFKRNNCFNIMWVIERVSIIKKYSVIGKSDLQLWSTVDRNRIIQVRNATIERKEKKKKS